MLIQILRKYIRNIESTVYLVGSLNCRWPAPTPHFPVIVIVERNGTHNSIWQKFYTKINDKKSPRHSSLVDYLAQVTYAKKLSHHILLHFSIGMGSYDHHAKYQGVFPNLLENIFFIRVPPLDKENLNEFKGGPLWKKCFLEGPETHPDI